ncbi:hypothetical protein Bca4012_057623 [Brassica carinata]
MMFRRQEKIVEVVITGFTPGDELSEVAFAVGFEVAIVVMVPWSGVIRRSCRVCVAASVVSAQHTAVRVFVRFGFKAH